MELDHDDSNYQACKAFLKSVPLLSALSNDQLSDLAQVLDQETYADGQEIVQSGTDADTMFFIRSGEVMPGSPAAVDGPDGGCQGQPWETKVLL